jgi:hypothetical protein
MYFSKKLGLFLLIIDFSIHNFNIQNLDACPVKLSVDFSGI